MTEVAIDENLVEDLNAKAAQALERDYAEHGLEPTA